MKKHKWITRVFVLSLLVVLILTGVTDKTTDVEAKIVDSGYGHTATVLTVGWSYCSTCGTQTTGKTAWTTGYGKNPLNGYYGKDPLYDQLGGAYMSWKKSSLNTFFTKAYNGVSYTINGSSYSTNNHHRGVLGIEEKTGYVYEYRCPNCGAGYNFADRTSHIVDIYNCKTKEYLSNKLNGLTGRNRADEAAKFFGTSTAYDPKYGINMATYTFDTKANGVISIGFCNTTVTYHYPNGTTEQMPCWKAVCLEAGVAKANLNTVFKMPESGVNTLEGSNAGTWSGLWNQLRGWIGNGIWHYKADNYTITWNTDDGVLLASATADGGAVQKNSTVPVGKTVVFSLTLKDGYIISPQTTVSGVNLSIKAGSNTFTMPEGNVVITVKTMKGPTNTPTPTNKITQPPTPTATTPIPTSTPTPTPTPTNKPTNPPPTLEPSPKITVPTATPTSKPLPTSTPVPNPPATSSHVDDCYVGYQHICNNSCLGSVVCTDSTCKVHNHTLAAGATISNGYANKSGGCYTSAIADHWQTCTTCGGLGHNYTACTTCNTTGYLPLANHAANSVTCTATATTATCTGTTTTSNCATCGGTGKKANASTCTSCNGTGSRLDTCPECGGDGKLAGMCGYTCTRQANGTYKCSSSSCNAVYSSAPGRVFIVRPANHPEAREQYNGQWGFWVNNGCTAQRVKGYLSCFTCNKTGKTTLCVQYTN